MVLTITVVAVVLALLGSLSHTSPRDAQFAAGPPLARGTTAAPPRPAHPREPTPPPLDPGGAPPPATAAAIRLRTSLSQAMRAAGPQSGALVYDLGTHTELLALRARVHRPPASVEKLWTTTALMRRLGPEARLHTSVLGTGSLRHGVWHGDLYLRGGGDPTLGDPTFNHVWDQGYGPTAAELAGQLARRGIHRVTGWVYGDESMFDRRRGGLITKYAVDVPDFGGQISALTYDHGTTIAHYSPATFAARELVATMGSAGIRSRASRHARSTPKAAHLLATVSSPPMLVMTRLMDVPSDDLFAEMFTKQLGVLFGHGGTISSGARVIAKTIAATYGLHPRILDGSGLSRDDRTSPLEIVDLLRELWQTTVGRELVDSLPIVGRTGTVQTIGLKTAAVGRCVAKTGTLNGVTNLAGYCHSRGHHAIAFGLFIDGPPNWTALVLDSRMIGAIAAY